MNILIYINHTFSPLHGGIANVSLWISRYLREAGHRVYLVSTKKTHPDTVDNQYYLSCANSSYCKENAIRFAEMCREWEIDIVINQSGTTPTHNESIRYANQANVPVVTVIHNSLSGIYGINARIKRVHPLLKALGLWQLADTLCQQIFKWKYGKHYRYQHEHSQRIVLLSNLFKDEYAAFVGLCDGKVTSIPNVLTLDDLPDVLPIKTKEVIFVGRLAAEKRVDLLLKIWSKVEEKFPDWKLTIVGATSESDTSLATALHRQATDLKLQRVSFEGYQSPKKYYQRGAIFCMTSAYEGFGLVLIEAMAFGSVPLAFNSYANACEIIDNTLNGFLISPFDVNDYAKHLAHLMNDQNLRTQMAIEAMKKSKVFSKEQITLRWEKLFKEIKSNKNS